MHTTFPTGTLRFASPLILVALAACGGGSSTPSGPAPTISNFAITPATASVGKSNTLLGTLIVTDADADASEVDATIVLPTGQSQALPPTPLTGAAGNTAEVVQLAILLMPPVAGSYQVSVVVKDAEGLPSNTLTATIVAQ